MIDVKKLYFSYTDKPFVENVSFHVGKGEIFGFLGPSGCLLYTSDAADE